MATAQPAAELESDDEIVARIAARDADSLRIVAEEHGELLYRIGYRMLGDQHEAEDLAQEALLRLWTHADRWQAGQSGIAAWLTRVTSNLCIDRIRKIKRLSDGPLPEREDDTPLADAQAEQSETRAAVADCISALPERQRAAIVLTYYEEMPNRGAGESLGMKLKAFESILHRARQAMRKCIERRGLGRDDAVREDAVRIVR